MQRLMLQQDKPEDFVIATAVQYSVCDFINAAAKELGLEICWGRQGVRERLLAPPAGGAVGVRERVRNSVTNSSAPSIPATSLPAKSKPCSVTPPRPKPKAKPDRTPRFTLGDLVAEMVCENLKSIEYDEFIKHHSHKAMNCHG